MRGGLPWVLVLAGCGFTPAAGLGPDAPGGSAAPDGSPGSNHVGSGDPDAAVTDAGSAGSAPGSDPTSPLVCPVGSGWFTVAATTSAYVASTDAHSWTQAEQNCELLRESGQSAIHLAVLADPIELAEVAAGAPQATYWIGMFQQAHQAAPDVGWLWLSGGSGITGQWADGEPNDDGGFFAQRDHENDDEDFAELDSGSTRLNDDSGDNSNRYLCECDGVAVPAAVLALVPR